MRGTRSLAAIIFSSALIVVLLITTTAASVVNDLEVYQACLYYKPTVEGASGVYDVVEPTYNSTNVSFFLDENISDVSDISLHSIGVMFYPVDNVLELERGYIYTFDFVFTMNQLDLEPQDYILQFGVCNDDMSLTAPLSDVVFTFGSKGTHTEFTATTVLNVDQDYDFSYVAPSDELYFYLEVIGSWSGNFYLRNYTQQVEKAVGEEAYYQASLDAINGLPQSEYDYVYNSMPDSEGEAQVVVGQIEEMYAQFNPWLDQITTLFKSDVSRPCMYIPEVVIPFLDIKVFDSHIFYVDDYLNAMNPDIMPKIEIVVWFIRFSAAVTFVYYTYYKVVRIEWWC